MVSTSPPRHRLARRRDVPISELSDETFIAHNVLSPYREIVLTGTLGKLEKLRSKVSPEIAAITAFPRLDPKRVLRMTADNGQSQSASALSVSVETAPPARQLDAVYTKNFKIDSPLWNARSRLLSNRMPVP